MVVSFASGSVAGTWGSVTATGLVSVVSAMLTLRGCNNVAVFI